MLPRKAFLRFSFPNFDGLPPQVNLSKCTKPVEWHDQALCPQNLDTNESPRNTYLKNLCCDNCEFQDPPKKDITNLLLASIIPGPAVLITLIFSFFLLRRRAARTSIRETKEGTTRTSAFELVSGIFGCSS